MTGNKNLHGIQGPYINFTADPFLYPEEECLEYCPDGLIVIEDGLIKLAGARTKVQKQINTDFPIRKYDNALIIPGFIDTHIHYPFATPAHKGCPHSVEL